MEQVAVQRFSGGKPAGGRLRVGAISANGALGSKASIPNRFETLLNTGVKESNAFGRRTYRFDEPENDLPGPGAYGKGKSSIKKNKNNFSKKGTAAFASAQKAGFNEDAIAYPTPGPGSYDLDAKLDKVNSSAVVTGTVYAQNQGPGSVSAAFASPTPKPMMNVKRRKVDNPGPGAYAMPDPWKVQTAPAKGSRAPRDTYDLQDKNQPGPGEHQRIEDISSCKVKDKMKVSSFNADKAPRFKEGPGASKLVPLPPSVSQQMGHNSLLVDVVGDRRQIEAQEVVSRTNATSPGLNSPISRAGVKPTAVFASSNLDRFGKCTTRFSAQEPPDVGPGSYLKDAPQRRLLISSSWALSAVPRSGTQGGGGGGGGGQNSSSVKPPGPAYYEPKSSLASRQNFHVPSDRYWS